MVLFRVKGVPVRLGWSWFAIFLLVLWSLAAAVFPARYPGLPSWSYLVLAGVATVLFFASLLVHELCHTLRSLREGVPVHDITLFLFGGVSRAEKPLPGPAAEFRVVLAGPAASAVLAAFFWALALAGRAADVPDVWTAVPDYLARINGLLLAFNLVPALPLDGGRLLHALLWWRSGDSSAATVHAARVGQAFAVALVAVGVLSLLTTVGVGGIWLALLGWFIFQGATQEEVNARAVHALSGLRARDLMATRLVTVDPEMTIEEFAAFLERQPSHPAYPVFDRTGRFVGLLPLQRAGAVPLERRASVRVGEVMLSGDGVPVVHADDLVVDDVAVLTGEPGRAVVLGDRSDDVVGLLSVSDVSRAVQRRRRGRWGVDE